MHAAREIACCGVLYETKVGILCSAEAGFSHVRKYLR